MISGTDTSLVPTPESLTSTATNAAISTIIPLAPQLGSQGLYTLLASNPRTAALAVSVDVGAGIVTVAGVAARRFRRFAMSGERDPQHS